MGDHAFHIAVLTKNRTNPAYVGARLGVDRFVASYGGHATHLVPEKPDNIEEQIALIGQAIALSPDAIILAPAHATRLSAAVDAIVQARIPLFYVVSETKPSPAVMFVGSDNEALGYAMAKRMCQHIGGSGAVAIVDGHVDSATSAPRSAGFKRALMEFPDVVCVSQFSGGYQRDVAYAAFADALTKIDALDGVIVANDYMAIGVLEALKETGRSVPVIGSNVTPAGVELMKSGEMIASAAFDAMSMGAIAIDGIVRTLRGETVPRRVLLPAQLVDRENLSDWDRDYSERETLSWDDAMAGAVD